MIAFTKQEGGQFYIGVMEANGSNERMIAKSFHVEGPTWAPNGRLFIIFYGRKNWQKMGLVVNLAFIQLI